jgi:molybdate transport system ATP-binding protein
MQKIIDIKDCNTCVQQFRMKEPVSLEILAGEQLAIVGDNASGKSRLIDIITGKYPLVNDIRYDFSPSISDKVYDNIKYVTFRDSYSSDTDESYYYQQRWNQQDIDESTPTAGSLLEAAFIKSKTTIIFRNKLIKLFHLEDLLDKYIISLSSGELRKFQLTKSLLSNPRVLIIDNPFIGLDPPTRNQLSVLLETLSAETNMLIIPVLSKTDEIPEFITHVVQVSDLKVGPKITLKEYRIREKPRPEHVLSSVKQHHIIGLPDKSGFESEALNGMPILEFRNVCIRYGKRTILRNLNWTVCQGDFWALSGENGAGKSTLLSLVCADNPQSYACDISLFGRKRGSGESIWEIKKRIGYVSPEMHRAYRKDLPSVEIVASGLYDSVGLYCKPKPEQINICEFWMDIFGIRNLAGTSFLKLSSGEQRLVLLARAFVKDPELIILDEPLHGLDLTNRRLVKDIIETFCRRKNKTLVMVTHYQEDLPANINHSLFLKKQNPTASIS